MAEELAWFEEGRWPVKRSDEISHHHFEDIRKRIFILRYPDCGHSMANPWDKDTTYGLGDYVLYGGDFTYRSLQANNSNHIPSDGTWWKKVANGIDYEIDTYRPSPPGGTGSSVYYRRGTLRVVWKKELWTNIHDITRAEWGSSYTLTSRQPPNEYYRPIRVKVGSTVYKSKKVHKSSSSFNNDLAAGNWQVDTVPDNYYTLDAWQPNHEYWISEWIKENSDWAHTVDYNKYHDFDSHKECRVLGYGGEGGGTVELIEQFIDYKAHQLMPIQTDVIEHFPPVKYLSGNKLRYTYKSKLGFDSQHITIPALAGAQWCNDSVVQRPPDSPWWERACPWGDIEGWDRNKAVGGNQYSNGQNLPEVAGSGCFWDKNPKVNQSYQCQIEMTCSASDLKYLVKNWPRYITNWEAYTGRDWHDDTYDSRPEFDDVDALFWGENASGFEFLKALTGQYDWYWDDEYPFFTIGHTVCRMGAGALADVPGSGHYFPLPAGTWRKWWKNSMGRPAYADGTPKFMRSQEMGAPAMGNYDGDKNQVTDSRTYETWYPAGMFVKTSPTIDAFMTWGYSISAVKDGNTIVIAGNHKSDLHSGAIVYIGSGTALENYQWAYVVKSAVVGSNTEVRLSISTAGLAGKMVRGNTQISKRHDPVQVDCTGGQVTPKYELTADLMNEMHDVLYHWTYKRLYPNIEFRWAETMHQVSIPKGHEGATVGEVWAALKGIGYLIDGNPDNWRYENNLYEGPDSKLVRYDDPDCPSNPRPVCYYGSGPGGCSAGCSVTNSWYYDTQGNLKYTAHPSGFYGWITDATAVRVDSVPAMWNTDQVWIRVSWLDTSIQQYHDLQELGYALGNGTTTQRAGSGANAISSTIVDRNEDVKRRYHWICLDRNGTWAVFIPQVFPGPTLVDMWPWPYQDPDPWNCYGPPPYQYTYSGGAGFSSLSFDTGQGIVLAINYNLCPESVMERDDWGRIDWHTAAPNDDHRPPLPDPCIWRVKPYAYFKKIQYNIKDYTKADIEYGDHFELHVAGEVCKAEDLDGSNPIKYRMVGQNGAVDSDWAESRQLDVLLEKMYWNKAVLSNSVHCRPGRLEDSVFVVDPLDHTKDIRCIRIPCENPAAVLSVGDNINLWDVRSPRYDVDLNPTKDSNAGRVNKAAGWQFQAEGYEVMAIGTDFVDVRNPYARFWSLEFHEPVEQYVMKTGDEGFNHTMWLIQKYVDYMYAPQAKDLAVPANAGKLGENCILSEPQQYPVALQ